MFVFALRLRLGATSDKIEVEMNPSHAPFGFSRRTMLKGAAALGAATVLPRWSSAQTAGDTYSASERWTLESRLVRRITYGATEAEVQRAQALGFDRYLNQQLAQKPDATPALQTYLAQFPELKLPAKDLFQINDFWPYAEKFFQATLARKILSNAQLYEKMVEFWSDHFNIYLWKDNVAGLKVVDDRDVIRKHALGTFPALLKASALSAAMMLYLDNAFSKPADPNQNYARELMELHTLGVDGGYTQQDVIEVARCFTGWGVGWVKGWPNYGMFSYDDSQHDHGKKTVLGHTIPANGGFADGLAVIDILANHPNTAKFISKKLCRFFLGDNPPQSVINAAAATYTSTGGNIPAILRTILRPANLAAAPLKIKRPLDLVVSAARALQPNFTNIMPLQWVLDGAGQPLYGWEPPNGYPDVGTFWASGLMERSNFAYWFMYGMEGLPHTEPRLLGNATNGPTMALWIDRVLHAGQMPLTERTAISDFVTNLGWFNHWVARESFARAISSPAFQNY